MRDNNIKHHIPENFLVAYAAGSLPETFALVVACHLTLCDECRAGVESYETLGGAILDRLPPTEPAATSLGATLSLISNRIASGNDVTDKTPADTLLPQPLPSYVGGSAQAIKWRRIGGGIKQVSLQCPGTSTARLLYIPAGCAVPEHGHGGLELTMVLQGAFADHIDRFARGDVELGVPALHHQPVAEAGEDCICLAATDSPLRFKDLLPRLLQPFMGI